MSKQDSLLQRSIGAAVRKLRISRSLSLQDLATDAKVSVSLISRIENGLAAPSLATMNSLANSLGVPVAHLITAQRRQTNVSFVKSGGGLTVERHGSGAGHQYQLLGHTPGGAVLVEPFLITLTDKSEEFEMLVHEGIEFMYVLYGALTYRIGERIYKLATGDSICFDSTAPHGPESVITVPVKLITVIGSSQV